MDCDVAKCDKDRFIEIENKVITMLTKVGWKRKGFWLRVYQWSRFLVGFVTNSIKKSSNTAWRIGSDELVSKYKVHIEILPNALEEMIETNELPVDKKLRMPVSCI